MEGEGRGSLSPDSQEAAEVGEAAEKTSKEDEKRRYESN